MALGEYPPGGRWYECCNAGYCRCGLNFNDIFKHLDEPPTEDCAGCQGTGLEPCRACGGLGYFWKGQVRRP